MLKTHPVHWFFALMLVTCASGSGMFGCATGVGVDETEPEDDDGGSPANTVAGPDSTSTNTGSGGAGPSTTGVGASGGVGGASNSTTANTTNSTATTSTNGSTTATTSTSGTTATGTSSTATATSSTATGTSVTATGTSVTATSSTVTGTSTAVTASSSGGCTPVNVLLDGGFETGPSGTAWTQFSTNFGTPICDVAGCGMGGGSGPAAGTYWAWFGGADFLSAPELGVTSQSVVIPVGMATLEFNLEMPVCDSFLDVFEARVDGQTVFLADGADPACGVMGYSQHIINISSFADGALHTIELRGENQAFFLGPTNFMVDDVMLVGCL